MRILTEVIEHAHDTMDEAFEYAQQAHTLRHEHKSLADCYIKISEAHVDIYKCLHEEMVDLIDEEKRKGKEPPVEMTAVWQYEHERLIKEFSECKTLIEEYKKSY